jgi:hypothetical protein
MKKGKSMKRETFSKGKIKKIEPKKINNKKIILNFNSKKDYSEKVNDKKKYKTYIETQIQLYPELFPPSIKERWVLYGFVSDSKKQNLKIRRIQTLKDKEVWQVYPSFVMPYMTCTTAEAEKILFLSNWVPDWALADVFGIDAMKIYRLRTHVSRYSIVGTTVKDPEKLPKNLVADEKHAKISGEKVYAAITAGENCFLGASVSETASEEDLTKAYGQFKQESQSVNPDYKPLTANTDGWTATINAWGNNFITIVIIQCFLHAILKIKEVSTKVTRNLCNEILEKVWEVYQSKDKTTFSQNMECLREWANKLSESKLKVVLLKLCLKEKWFSAAYDFENAHRTSNMIDRLINRLDRRLFIGKWWHGSIVSAEKGLRSFCLLENFCPYCPITRKKYGGKMSAFERLNGFRYHDCWLENLLIATSIQGIYIFQQKKL